MIRHLVPVRLTPAVDRFFKAQARDQKGVDPWLVELEESRYSVHGNDERLSVESIDFGLRFYVGAVMEMAGQ